MQNGDFSKETNEERHKRNFTSEDPASKKKSPLKEKKPTPKAEPSDEEMETEESVVETISSPEKKKEKPVRSFFTLKASGTKSKTITPEVKADPATPVAAKSKNAFASFFSPNSGAAKMNEGGTDYDQKVMAVKYHPAALRVHDPEQAGPRLGEGGAEQQGHHPHQGHCY
jgi:hypothetical protein